jgi:hypothetical protein
LSLVTLSAFAAEPKDELKVAAKKLAQQPNYSWSLRSKSQNGAGGPGADSDGKTEKDGYTFLTVSFGNTDIDIALKGEKAAVKLEDEWKGTDELEGNSAATARRLKAFKLPAAEIEAIIGQLEDVKKGDEGVYSGELTDAGVKEIFARVRRSRTAPTDAKGNAKFWVKDGLVTKYQYSVQGKVTAGQEKREVELDRTTTVDIKDIGSTKVNLPDDAKKKLS